MWNVIGTSVPGTSHHRLNIPCQDARGHKIISDYLLVAVADGLGSARHSHKGSEVAVQKSIETLEANILRANPALDESSWQEIMRDSFAQAQQAIFDLAQSENLPINEFATTLICAVAGNEWLIVGQIGDSFAVIETEDGRLDTAIVPLRHEYAGVVISLTSSNALKHLIIKVSTEVIHAIVLSSDGLDSLAVAKRSDYMPYPPFFQPLLTFARTGVAPSEAEAELTKFLESDRVCERTDDDKTLLIATKISVSPKPSLLITDIESQINLDESEEAEDKIDQEITLQPELEEVGPNNS